MRPFVARLGCEKLVVVEVYEADELAESTVVAGVERTVSATPATNGGVPADLQSLALEPSSHKLHTTKYEDAFGGDIAAQRCDR